MQLIDHDYTLRHPTRTPVYPKQHFDERYSRENLSSQDPVMAFASKIVNPTGGVKVTEPFVATIVSEALLKQMVVSTLPTCGIVFSNLEPFCTDAPKY